MRPTSSGIYLVPRAPGELDAARRGRTYAAVAGAAGCSTSFLCELTTGQTMRVRADLAGRIEDALDRPRGELFTLADNDADLLRPYLARPA